MKSAHTTVADESGPIPHQDSAEDERQARIKEIIALSKSDQNSTRLRYLLFVHHTERASEINQILGLEQSQAVRRLFQQRETHLQMLQSLDHSMNRADLTIAELLWLSKVHHRTIQQVVTSLVAERKLIAARHPGA